MQDKLNTFTEHFADIDDPRVNVHNQWHTLEDILLLTVLAVLCGANNWKEIEQFGNAKLEWLKTFMELSNGIPSHDTLGRVFSLINPQEQRAGFLSWVTSLAKLDGEFVAIDGKTLLCSYEAGVAAAQYIWLAHGL